MSLIQSLVYLEENKDTTFDKSAFWGTPTTEVDIIKSVYGIMHHTALALVNVKFQVTYTDQDKLDLLGVHLHLIPEEHLKDDFMRVENYANENSIEFKIRQTNVFAADSKELNVYFYKHKNLYYWKPDQPINILTVMAHNGEPPPFPHKVFTSSHTSGLEDHKLYAYPFVCSLANVFQLRNVKTTGGIPQGTFANNSFKKLLGDVGEVAASFIDEEPKDGLIRMLVELHKKQLLLLGSTGNDAFWQTFTLTDVSLLPFDLPMMWITSEAAMVSGPFLMVAPFAKMENAADSVAAKGAPFSSSQASQIAQVNKPVQQNIIGKALQKIEAGCAGDIMLYDGM